MTESRSFEPDWASPPGDTIADVLRSKGWATTDLASQLSSPEPDVSRLLAGDLAITESLAMRLASALGGSATFWLTRESNYRRALQRRRTREWLNELPLAHMKKQGWLMPSERSEVSSLEFFGVPSVDAFEAKYREVFVRARFHISSAFSVREAAVASWLRYGELQAEKTITRTWDPRAFGEKLRSLKRFTREEDPNVFIPALASECAECGVALVIARTPPQCPASGATFFQSPQKAVMLLSFRHLSDDQFWFAFFHEAGHLVLHAAGDAFIEGVGASSPQEAEANAFAAEVLVSAELRTRLETMPIGLKSIARFAREAGISPGIVVGQLQHMRRIHPSHWNRLKKRYQW